jgi:hypothetical protein
MPITDVHLPSVRREPACASVPIALGVHLKQIQKRITSKTSGMLLTSLRSSSVFEMKHSATKMPMAVFSLK